ncbi:MAG: pirin family protein [Actinomycetales bacterium]|nr:pirin family protein [Actinomycetales bacterium]
MPAVTADTMNLSRLGLVTGQPRLVKSVTYGPNAYEGDGFPVTRAFAGVSYADLDPFIHMDQMGEVEYAPLEPRGTSWHPHRGFETFTYMIDGTFQHQDNHGGGGVIKDGATQYMTAGSGVLHIETPPAELVMSGGVFHGIQLWINLPSHAKMSNPKYQNLEGGDVTLLASHDGGSLIRVLAGEVDGHVGPGQSFTPITVVHVSVAPGASVSIPWNPEFNALAYALAGSGRVGEDGDHSESAPIRVGGLAVLHQGDRLVFSADAIQDARYGSLELFVIGGQPIREPVVAYGPFVMNTKQQIIEAMDDFNYGRFGQIPENALQPFHG